MQEPPGLGGVQEEKSIQAFAGDSGNSVQILLHQGYQTVWQHVQGLFVPNSF